MSRWTAVSDYDYMAEGQDPPHGQTRDCSICGEPYDVLADDSFVLHPTCDTCIRKGLDEGMVRSAMERQRRCNDLQSRLLERVEIPDTQDGVK